MAMVGVDNAQDIAAAEVKGIGLPTPTLEKQTAVENMEPFPRSISSSEVDDDDGLRIPTEEELGTLRRVPAQIPWIAFTGMLQLCRL